MPDYKVVLNQESIYDVAEIAEYIEDKFSRQKADEFQRGIEKEFTKMVTNAKLYPGMIMECADFFGTLFLCLKLGGSTNERALFDKNYINRGYIDTCTYCMAVAFVTEKHPSSISHELGCL